MEPNRRTINPETICKFGYTSQTDIIKRFKNHPLLEFYDLEATFSVQMTSEEASRVESEYLQKYDRYTYDFGLKLEIEFPFSGWDEMRCMDKGVINKVIGELYGRKKLEWQEKAKQLAEERVAVVKFYFVRFTRKVNC